MKQDQLPNLPVSAQFAQVTVLDSPLPLPLAELFSPRRGF
jgi:hypothetical protein